jgi:hypothetical protein
MRPACSTLILQEALHFYEASSIGSHHGKAVAPVLQILDVQGEEKALFAGKPAPTRVEPVGACGI